MKQTGGYNRPWANYFVLSKRAWQKYMQVQKHPTYTLSIRNQWIAESEDKAMLEGMMKLFKE